MSIVKIFHPVAKEFRSAKCGFDHSPPDDFVRSQWQKSTISIVYLCYRWATAVFFFGVVITAMTMHFMRGRFFIYLTNWGIMMCMITNIFGAVLVTLWYFHPKYAQKLENITVSDPVPVCFSIFWGLHTITLTSSLVITIIYWGVLYKLYTETIPVDLINIFEHALNSVLMTLDLLIVAFPIRIYHIFLSVLFLIVYAVFSVIYYFAGGTDDVGNGYIYPILDWSKPAEAMTTVAMVALLFAIFPFILFSLYKLRVLIHRHYSRNQFTFPIGNNGKSYENRGFHNDGIPRTSL